MELGLLGSVNCYGIVAIGMAGLTLGSCLSANLALRQFRFSTKIESDISIYSFGGVRVKPNSRSMGT